MVPSWSEAAVLDSLDTSIQSSALLRNGAAPTGSGHATAHLVPLPEVVRTRGEYKKCISGAKFCAPATPFTSSDYVKNPVTLLQGIWIYARLVA